MSDISQQQMDDLISSMKSSAGSLTKIADKFGASSSGKANATNKLSDDLKKKRNQDTKSIEDHYNSIKRATKSTDSLVDSFTSAAKGFAGLWVIGEIVKYGKENVDTYRELTKAGQSFGGSMINMTHAAASAGLPLQTFAKIIKDNSNIVNQLGTKTFFQMNKTLRDSIESQGLYGYSLEELGDLQGTYMEQQRMAGKSMQYIGSQQNQKNLADFAANIVDVSAALGNQRDAVMKNYQAATDSAEFAGAQRLNEARGLGDYNKAMQEAIVSVGAQLGEAGSMLSKGLAQAFTLPGGANFSELGKQFVKAGLGGGVALMDEAKQRIAAGENQSTVTMETMNAMAKMVQNPANVAALELQAQAGNDAAVQILQLTKNMKVYTQADLDAKAKERSTMDTFTAFFESFESIFDKLKGSFIDGFLTPFADKSGKFDAFWKGLDELADPMKNLGSSLGSWIHDFLSKDNIERLKVSVVELIKDIKDTANFISQVINILSPLAKVLGTVFGVVVSGLNEINKRLGPLGTGLALVTAYFGGKGLMAVIGNFFKKTLLQARLVEVEAATVNVNGAGGGGGGGGGGNLSKAEKAEKEAAAAGKTGKAVKEAEEAAAEAGKVGKLGKFAAKFGKVGAAITGIVTLGGLGEKIVQKGGGLFGQVVGSGAAKAIGKVGGTLLPGVGAAIDLASSYNSFKGGNSLAGSLYGIGAGLNGAGAASAATGIGLAATPFLDGAGFIASSLGMAADFTGIGQKKVNPVNPANLDNYPTAAPDTKSKDAANPKAVDITKLPTFKDEELAQLRTNAILGDQKAITELNKIQEALKQQTMVLYSVQQKAVEEQRKAAAAAAAQNGY